MRPTNPTKPSACWSAGVDPGPQRLAGQASGRDTAWFVDATADTRLDFSHANGTTGDLTIGFSDTEFFSIQAEDNLLPYITTTLDNGVLVIETQPGANLQPTQPIRYTLVLKQLDSIRNSSTGESRRCCVIRSPKRSARSVFSIVPI